MISGSVGKSRNSRRASRIASSQSGARGAALGDVGGVALVVEQVDHGRDRRESLAALDRAGRLELRLRRVHAFLGACDALLHGGLGDEEGARDPRDREPRDDPQRQRDLLCGAQAGIAADEEEPQDVVAVIGLVDPPGERLLGVGEIRQHFLRRQQAAKRSTRPIAWSAAPSSSPPAFGVIAPSSKSATAERPSTCANPIALRYTLSTLGSSPAGTEVSVAEARCRLRAPDAPILMRNAGLPAGPEQIVSVTRRASCTLWKTIHIPSNRSN
jgi:hypothetical protein